MNHSLIALFLLLIFSINISVFCYSHMRAFVRSLIHSCSLSYVSLAQSAAFSPLFDRLNSWTEANTTDIQLECCSGLSFAATLSTFAFFAALPHSRYYEYGTDRYVSCSQNVHRDPVPVVVCRVFLGFMWAEQRPGQTAERSFIKIANTHNRARDSWLHCAALFLPQLTSKLEHAQKAMSILYPLATKGKTLVILIFGFADGKAIYSALFGRNFHHIMLFIVHWQFGNVAFSFQCKPPARMMSWRFASMQCHRPALNADRRVRSLAAWWTARNTRLFVNV